jgi:hypothetical protein
MTVEIITAIALIAAFVFGWAFFHKSQPLTRADTSKVDADFDAKKRAEAQRIDGEDIRALRDDFNSNK